MVLKPSRVSILVSIWQCLFRTLKLTSPPSLPCLMWRAYWLGSMTNFFAQATIKIWHQIWGLQLWYLNEIIKPPLSTRRPWTCAWKSKIWGLSIFPQSSWKLQTAQSPSDNQSQLWWPPIYNRGWGHKKLTDCSVGDANTNPSDNSVTKGVLTFWVGLLVYGTTNSGSIGGIELPHNLLTVHFGIADHSLTLVLLE